MPRRSVHAAGDSRTERRRTSPRTCPTLYRAFARGTAAARGAHRCRAGDVRARRSRAALRPHGAGRCRRRRADRDGRATRPSFCPPARASPRSAAGSSRCRPPRCATAAPGSCRSTSCRARSAPLLGTPRRAAQAVAAARCSATSARRASPDASSRSARSPAHARRLPRHAAHRDARTGRGWSSGSTPTRSTRCCPPRPTPDLDPGRPPGDAPASIDDRPRPALRHRSAPPMCPASAARPGSSSTSSAHIDRRRRRRSARRRRHQPQEMPPLIDLAPAGGLRTIVVDAGHGGDDGAKGRGGHRSRRTSRWRRAAAEGGARSAARRARAPDARRRRDGRARRARGARQQQQGGPLHQPARQRLGAAGGCAAPRCST